ncbi:MAG: hypothetical protein HY860_01345 [Chlamydiales bacterium]|nr:hypothetical protein [Chlamydiales bacterium]
MIKHELTNETIMKHFDNNFELALYAIDIAQRLIKTGKEVKIGKLLEEIKKHPDQFEIEEPIESEDEQSV